ncbi:hypothetical protein F4780DRAFT_621391 [Xylariomycetidae sp. FL0641]|nr:hypothetical protein F4780DRAFT_621391 [Xylariomycetidae sp. FL0641]
MSSRSANRRSRYDDPYTVDDHRRRPRSVSHAAPAYEYIGTDEAEYPEPPPHTFAPEPRYAPTSGPKPHRRPSPSRRHSRTTSPPRRSRPSRAHSPRPKAPVPREKKRNEQSKRQRYHEFAQKPAVQRTKSFGRQGLNLLGEAAAAYAAAQAGGGEEEEPESPRPRSLDRDELSRRRRHHRRRSPSPSPSPSPPPRRRSTRHGERSRASMSSRHRSYSRSPSPPPRSRDLDSEYERDRGRRHRRSRHRSPSLTPSPPPRSRRGRSGPPSSFRSSLRDEYSSAPNANAERWQMAARAALEAGGLTAFRLRKEPGSWTGDKGAKIATAALGAAAIDAFIDKDPRRSRSSGRGMKGMAENAVSSMLASQLMGFKSSSKGKGDRR